MGYKGNKNAVEVCFNGLKKLEYRGYDSWGIAAKDKEIEVFKKIGKISGTSIKDIVPKDFRIAISHTRWATHGGVTEQNTHPHISNNRRIAAVHNGIIENFQELRKSLREKGYTFHSETDTEIIPILIEDYMKQYDFPEAVRKTLLDLEGSFAVVIIDKDFDGMIAARKDSPLVLGIGENEYFIASDIPAFLEHTKKVIFLDDNEMAILNKELEIRGVQNNNQVQKQITIIEWSPEQAMKGDFEHFMLKEIYEQPAALKRAAAESDEKLSKIAEEINKGFGTFFVACGTAYHAGLTSSYIFSKIAKKHVNLSIASEFPSYENFITEKTLMIPISQSGETADVLGAVKSAKKKKAKICSVINAAGSTLDRLSDERLYIKAGPEIGVASTKAYTSQVAVLMLLAYAAIDKLDYAKILLGEASKSIKDMLEDKEIEKIKRIAEAIKDAKSIFTIGRDINYSTAMEAALKIKEISYIHAEGFAGGELKHGTIALIEQGTPVIVFSANDHVKKETISNAMEVKARGGLIIGIAPEDNDIFDYWIKVPDFPEISPIVNIVPAQLLAYYLAVFRGNNPDKPRNLAKSVTVK